MEQNVVQNLHRWTVDTDLGAMLGAVCGRLSGAHSTAVWLAIHGVQLRSTCEIHAKSELRDITRWREIRVIPSTRGRVAVTGGWDH